MVKLFFIMYFHTSTDFQIDNGREINFLLLTILHPYLIQEFFLKSDSLAITPTKHAFLYAFSPPLILSQHFSL